MTLSLTYVTILSNLFISQESLPMSAADNNITFYKKLSLLQQIPFSIYHRPDHKLYPAGPSDVTRLLAGDGLADRISRLCDRMKDCPCIYIELEDILYGCIRLKDFRYLIIGPAVNGRLTFPKKHDLLKLHRLTEHELPIGTTRFYSFLDLLSLIYLREFDIDLSGGEILHQNQTFLHSKAGTPAALLKSLEMEKARRLRDDEIAEQYHHTYLEERQWTECVKNGDTAGARTALSNLMRSAGILSKDAVKHYKYLSVTAVVLCTRAAIEGGVDPAEAYAASDIFIDKIDRYEKLVELNRLPEEISDKYTDMVKADIKSRTYSNYVEQCKQYISRHYREGYTLKALSEYLGLNESYLSHLFVQSTGLSMKEYLNRVRTECAENLLKYSDSSLVEISNYVGFSSQSYFGSVFKRIVGMTPRQYRNRYHVKEF